MVSLEIVEQEHQKFLCKTIVQQHHSYKKTFNTVGKQINWLIKNGDNYIGVIGIGSAMLGCIPRDEYIGWNKELRVKNINKIANNWRFCLIKNSGINASQILSIFEKEAKIEWKKKYGQDLLLIETLVEPPHTGACYKSANWIHIGKTKGMTLKWMKKDDVLKEPQKYRVVKKNFILNGKIDDNKWKVQVLTEKHPKDIFVKPLEKNWRGLLWQNGIKN